VQDISPRLPSCLVELVQAFSQGLQPLLDHPKYLFDRLTRFDEGYLSVLFHLDLMGRVVSPSSLVLHHHLIGISAGVVGLAETVVASVMLVAEAEPEPEKL
jgi:hypothetical protein